MADNVTDLYVTDYTRNSNAATYIPESLRKTSGDLPIFRIGVWGERDVVKNMEMGQIYKFNLKVKDDKSGGLKGSVKHGNAMIQKVSVKHSDREEVADLLKSVDVVFSSFLV